MGSIHYYHLVGRFLLGIVFLYMGVLVVQNGNDFYGPYLHAIRHAVSPATKNRISPELTFEDLHKYFAQGLGVLLIVGGSAIAIGKTKTGPLLVILCMLLIIGLQDNPLLMDHIKPTPKYKNYRWNELFRHVSVVGACLLVMATEPDLPTEEAKTKTE